MRAWLWLLLSFLRAGTVEIRSTRRWMVLIFLNNQPILSKAPSTNLLSDVVSEGPGGFRGVPCGGGGFSGGVPGCGMSGEGSCDRPGFSGGVPGSGMCWEGGMRPGGFGGARGAGGVGFGAGGA
eukprot:2506368-Rhodomonas_salina.1